MPTPDAAMAERADELALRIAESLWYGYPGEPVGPRAARGRVMRRAALGLPAGRTP
jgi:hypothetical protein